MGDRRDYRGGGGGKRKRYREDDDYDRDGYRNQRHRPEAPPGTRIKRNLLEIAEDVNGRAPRDTKEQAAAVAKIAAENWEDEYVRDVFCLTILKM